MKPVRWFRPACMPLVDVASSWTLDVEPARRPRVITGCDDRAGRWHRVGAPESPHVEWLGAIPHQCFRRTEPVRRPPPVRTGGARRRHEPDVGADQAIRRRLRRQPVCATASAPAALAPWWPHRPRLRRSRSPSRASVTSALLAASGQSPAGDGDQVELTTHRRMRCRRCVDP